MAVIVDVAEAIKDELEAIDLSQSFTLRRSYGDWEDLLEDIEHGLYIDVIPQSCSSELHDRKNHLYECVVSVLLRRRLKAENRRGGRIANEVVDQCVDDLQTVHQFFAPSQPTYQGRKLAAFPQARWSNESAIKAPYSRKMLRDHGQYSGWVSVVYEYPVAFG